MFRCVTRPSALGSGAGGLRGVVRDGLGRLGARRSEIKEEPQAGDIRGAECPACLILPPPFQPSLRDQEVYLKVFRRIANADRGLLAEFGQ